MTSATTTTPPANEPTTTPPTAPKWRIDFWREALTYALDRDGAHHLGLALDQVPEHVAIAIADSLSSSADEENEFDVPHPTASDLENTRVREVEQRYQKRIAELERLVDCFTNSVATRRRVDPAQVYVDNLGRVAISPR